MSQSGSPILRAIAACEARGGVDLASGVPQAQPLPATVQAAQRALADGHHAYAPPRGLPSLRLAIASRLRRFGVEADAERELLLTHGATGALISALLALFQPGDEVLLLEPYFGWHRRLLRVARLQARALNVGAPSRPLTREALLSAVGPRTRGLLLCSPANPTGKVLTAAELEIIADVAERAGLRILSDETYAEFCFTGSAHRSPAAVEGLRSRSLVVGSFSKSMAVTGWRLGFATGPEPWIDAVDEVHEAMFICPATPLQRGLVEAVEAGATAFDVVELERRCRRLGEALEGVGFSVWWPQGGFFLLADCSHIRALATDDPAMALLERCGVAAVGGEAFSTRASDWNRLRFCFAKSEATLEEACRRLATL